jgi:integrase
MTGSLQVKKGIFYAVVRIPDDMGIEHQKWISTGLKADGNNKREANQRCREILTDLEQKKITYSTDIMFIDWLNLWMEQKEHEVRLITWECYQLYIQTHIVPFFKPLKLTLQSINAQHIQNYYNKKLKAGQSANSVKKHSVVLRGALQEALKKNLIPFNPVDRATLPKVEHYIGKAYSVEEANRLLSVLGDEPMKPAIILGLFYGLRRSEVLGLRWCDIDFLANTISIRNTVVRFKTEVAQEKTKSRASKRTLYIIPETRDYLIDLHQKQINNRQLLKDAYIVTDRVCTWDNGEPFKPNYLSRHFDMILRKHNLPKIRFHELRHTAGSLLLNKGLSAKQIQEYLGHERVSTTLDSYGHLSVEGKKEAAFVIGGLLAAEAL